MKKVLNPEILKKSVTKAYRLMYESGELPKIFPAVNFSVIRLTEQGTTIAATVH